jgi:aspartate 1-decarboxylase
MMSLRGCVVRRIDAMRTIAIYAVRGATGSNKIVVNGSGAAAAT